MIDRADRTARAGRARRPAALRRWVGVATVLLAAAAGCMGVAVASADSTTVKVDRQDSQADTPVSPYADGDLHVALEGGSETQHSYVHLDFSSLKQGSTINSLILSLTQSSSSTGNVSPQNASIRACVLLKELPAQYDPNNPPQWDCNRGSAPGSPDGSGGWKFDLQPLVAGWNQLGNTGAAITAVPEPATVGSALGPQANNWALAFDPTKSAAKADVTPPAATSSSPRPAVSAGAAPAPTAAAVAPVPAAPAPLLAAPLLAAAAPAPVPPATAPSPTPAPARPTAAAVAAGVGVTTPAAVPTAPSTAVSTGWVVVAILLTLAAIAAMGVAGVRQVALRGSLSVGTLLASLGSARSRLATPVTVLFLGAVLAAGFASRPLASGQGAGTGAPQADAGALPGGSASAGAASDGSAGSGALPPSPGAGGPGTSGGVAVAGPAGGAVPGAAPQAPPSRGAVGSGGASPAGGPGGAATAPLPRGVTATTVKVGFFSVSNTNAVNSAAGINGLNNTGDDQAQAKAMAQWVNAHGGIGGRMIDPVIVAVDGSNTDPTYTVQLCHTMVDDKQVFAVVNTLKETQDATQCYMSSHTLYFGEGLVEYDAATIAGWGSYYWSPSLPNLDRSMAEELDALQSKSFFTSKDKVGYFYLDQASTQATISRTVSPRLSRMGYDVSNPNAANGVVTVGISSSSSVADELSAINNGMLKMKTSNVTKVFYVDDAGGTIALFSMRDADNLNYHTVSYGLQSLDGLDAVAYLEPTDQVQNSVGVGYLPWADTSTANSDGFPGSSAEAQCLKIMNDAGIATPTPPGRDGEATVGMMSFCDAVMLLYQGSQGLGQNLTVASFAAGAEHLGNAYQSGLAYSGGSFVGPRHHDADDVYRTLHWDTSCTNGYDGGSGKGSTGCFRLDSRTSYRSPEV